MMSTTRYFILTCLLVVITMERASTFVLPGNTNPSWTLRRHVSWHHNRQITPRRMAGEESMDDAIAKAKELQDKANALREEAAAAAAEIAPDVPPETEPASPGPEEMSEEEPPKPAVSDMMKARLRKELESQGANPNKNAGNPILVVAAVIGVLVIIGGQGKTFCSRHPEKANPFELKAKPVAVSTL